MNNKVLTLLAVAAGLMLISVPVFAHHGDAGRYEDNLTDPEGNRSRDAVDHSAFGHRIRRPRRERQDGALAGGDGRRPAMIKDFGWTKDTLKPGDKITLTGRRVKSGAPYMNLTDRANIVMTETGKEIFRTKNYGTEERKHPAAGLGDQPNGDAPPPNN